MKGGRTAPRKSSDAVAMKLFPEASMKGGRTAPRKLDLLDDYGAIENLQ